MHEKHESEGIFAIKFDDKINEYFSCVSCVLCVSWLNKKCVMGALEPRIGVHGWVWVRCFQEHEYARIDTNAYVMGIWNHEMH